AYQVRGDPLLVAVDVRPQPVDGYAQMARHPIGGLAPGRPSFVDPALPRLYVDADYRTEVVDSHSQGGQGLSQPFLAPSGVLPPIVHSHPAVLSIAQRTNQLSRPSRDSGF